MKKRLFSLLFAILFCFSCVTVSGIEDDNVTTEDNYTNILILGNSLVLYNDMCKTILPEMFESAGKEVKITSITKSGTSMYDFANEQTTVGDRTLKELKNNVYDYVILQPSRQVTPFEYTVYHAEKIAVKKLNEMANDIGAKTLILAEPGINLGKIRTHSMNEEGTNAKKRQWLPIDRKTHSVYFENLCEDYCQEMTNANVVKIGNATELVLKYFPDFDSFYAEDKRHPSIRGSYLQALCIYSAIFEENYIGKSYTNMLTKYNALTLQRAAAITMCEEPEETLFANEAERVLNATLIDEKTATLSWNEPLPNIVSGYNIYRKKQGGKYQLLETITAENCEYTDATLESGYKYSYKIKAIQTVGDLTFLTGYSSVASIESLLLPKIKLTSAGKGKVTVEITKVKGSGGYEIQLRKKNIKEYKSTRITSNLSYTFKKLPSKQKYYFRVRAYSKENGAYNKLSPYAVSKIKVK